MQKRKRSESAEAGSIAPAVKRHRSGTNFHFLNLSDELILKILSFLRISDLVIAQRVSCRLQRLANDGEIWKEKYYERWVQPRARRIPGMKAGSSNFTLGYSSKLAKWLNHSHLLRGDGPTDWKKQYKIRTNWWRGKCRKRQLEIARPPESPVIVKMHKGIVFTADTNHGLRAWSKDFHARPLATHSFGHAGSSHPAPTSLGVDSSCSDQTHLVVGFSDGSFTVVVYGLSEGFEISHSHKPSSNGSLSSVAVAFPFILTISGGKVMSLYQLEPRANSAVENQNLIGREVGCCLRASLRSDAAYSSMSLSMRISTSGLTACIAYAFCRLNLGWSVGLQELRLTQKGDLVDCRLAQTAESICNQPFMEVYDPFLSTRTAFSQPFTLHPQLMSCPSSLSYTHPYLVASLADNTLMVYLVISDADKLYISLGRRLWGHTSSVSGAEVNDRGKAVSVSTKGDEIRVWELEDIVTSTSQRRSSTRIDPVPDLSIVTGGVARRSDGLGISVRGLEDEIAIRRSWVGFDDEQVVVLGEQSSRQILSCYDFT